MRAVLCVLAVCVAGAIAAAALPPFIHPCSASDPNLSRCISKVIEQVGPKFADGLPDLGIAPLDPVQLGTVRVNSNALKLVFSDTIVTGLKNFRLNHFNIDQGNGKVQLDFTANVTLKAQYDMDGKILILPIKGNGHSKIKITNLNIIINYDYETKNDHWEVLSYSKKYKMDRAQFKFSNLFGGNKQLADSISGFANQNWHLIMQEIAPPAIAQIIKTCLDKVIQFYDKSIFAFYVTPDPDGKSLFVARSLALQHLFLGNTVHTVVNANWEPVIRDIAPVAFEQIIKACVEEVKKLFAAVPADKLLLP